MLSKNIKAHSVSSDQKCALVADLGGTNARFAIVKDQDIGEIRSFLTSDFQDICALINEYLRHTSIQPTDCILSIAGPVKGGRASLTNADLEIETSVLMERFPFCRLEMINDFEAVAWASTEIRSQEVSVVRGSSFKKTGNRVVIGPGTGLGVGAVLRSQNNGTLIHCCEGGHAGLSPSDALELRVFERLSDKWPEVAFEKTFGLEAEYPG